MTLFSIQYLRIVAAMMVLLSHLYVPWQRLGHEGPAPGWLSAGVDIFFVLSGMIIWTTTAGKTVAPAQFYRRRVIRIVPLYWLLTSLLVTLLLVYPAVLSTARFDLWHIVSSYLFLPARHPTTGLMQPLLIPGWTMNYEMFFYLLYGAALFLPLRVRLPALLAALAALTTVGLFIPDNTVAGFYTDPIICEFGLGLVIGWAYRRNLAPPRAAAIGLIALGFTAVFLSGGVDQDPRRLLLWGLPATAIVAGALALERSGGVARFGPALLVGNATYSLALFHGIVLAAIAQAWRFLGLDRLPYSLAAYAAVAVAGAVIASLIIHLAVERPIARRFRPAKA